MMNTQTQYGRKNPSELITTRKAPRSVQFMAHYRGAEKGIVLFIALIALVALSLAGLAMVRSVDTSNLVASNIALKQGAIQETDAGMNEAFRCLDKQGALLAPGVLNNNYAPCNYYASLQPDTSQPFGVADVLETVPVLSTPAVNPHTGNTTRYIIERMCTATGQWQSSACLDSPWGGVADAWKDYRADGDKGGGRGGPLETPQALYRITIKVSGPRNLNAYSQMIVNAPR